MIIITDQLQYTVNTLVIMNERSSSIPNLMNVCQSSPLGGIFSKEIKPLVKAV